MKLSFIICTRNRAGAILDCLHAVETAIAKADVKACEIVIVDNGSTDDTPRVLKEWGAGCDVDTQIIQEPKAGLSYARNAGFKAAQGEIIACTDDDCHVHEGFVVDLLKHFEADGNALVLRGGRVELGDADDLPLSIKTQDYAQRWHRDDADKDYNLGDSLMGCSFMMKRAVFETIGLFDTKLGAGSKIPGAEDTDYIYRCYLAGITIEYVPDMAISHFHGRRGAEEGRKLFRNYALGWGALYTKYMFRTPQFIRPFWWDFKNAVREVLKRKNTFMPDSNFSHIDKVRYSILGAVKYIFS